MLEFQAFRTSNTQSLNRAAHSDGLDVLIPGSRMNASARCLLHAMGVSIAPVRWRNVNGPAAYRLLASGRPRLTWLAPTEAEELLAAFRDDENERRMPQWLHLMLHAHRRAALTDFDGGIDFGEPGLDAATVLRDLLHYPA